MHSPYQKQPTSGQFTPRQSSTTQGMLLDFRLRIKNELKQARHEVDKNELDFIRLRSEIVMTRKIIAKITEVPTNSARLELRFLGIVRLQTCQSRRMDRIRQKMKELKERVTKNEQRISYMEDLAPHLGKGLRLQAMDVF